MKLNKIMTFFCVGLPICVVLRIFQIVFTVEFETGFYKTEFRLYGKMISVVIFGFCLLLWWFASRYYKSVEKPPKGNILLSISALAVAATVLIQSFSENMLIYRFSWQPLIMKLGGISAALYFAAFALNNYFSFKFPPVLHIIPCVFMILRTIFVFINTSALAHISDNILLIAAYCVLMVFFLNFARLYNEMDTEKNFKKLLSSGLVSAILCFTVSVPHFVVNIASGNAYLHLSNITSLSLLVLGIFVSVFTVTHYCFNKD